MKFLAALTFLVSSSAFANASVQQVDCRSKEGIRVNVEVDVLESLPPQSQITVTTRDGSFGFSAFTDYVSLESNPPQDQWTWRDLDNNYELVVVSRNGKVGKGYIKGMYRDGSPISTIELSCTLQ